MGAGVVVLVVGFGVVLALGWVVLAGVGELVLGFVDLEVGLLLLADLFELVAVLLLEVSDTALVVAGRLLF